MAPNPRVAKAFCAMRELGILEETVKPVLKNLLKLYEKNWQLIEAENYRALADAIFEQEEAKAQEQKRRDEMAVNLVEEEPVNEEPERPLKRLRLRHQEGHASTSIDNLSSRANGALLRQPKEEVVELPDVTWPSQPTRENASYGSHLLSPSSPVRNKGKEPMLQNSSSVKERVDASQTDAADRTLPLTTNGTGSYSLSPALLRREKGKESILSQTSLSDRLAHPLRLKEPKVEPGIILVPKQQMNNSNTYIKPKDEPVTDDVSQFVVPLAVIHPEPLNAGNSSQLSDSVRRPDCPTPLISQSEDRGDGVEALSNDKITNCEPLHIVDNGSSKLEMAFSNNEEVSIDATPSDIQKQNLQKQSIIADDLGVGDKPVGHVNGSVSSQHDDELAQSRVPMHTPCSNGNNCGKTLNNRDECRSVFEKESIDLEHVNSHNPVVQSNQPTSDDGKPLHSVVDISKGQESVVISFVNEVNDECLPSFQYVPRNVIYQNAYVNFSLARIGESCCLTCVGDCLSSPTPCDCAHETGGEFAYTPEGLVKEDMLKESVSMNRDPDKHCLFYCNDCPLERLKNGVVEPCKGHLMRRFIKECWWKCGCGRQCGNRVVQRGINCKLQVFMTPEGKGWGLRTLEDLPKGAFVCEYVGEVLTNAELFERVSQRSSNEEHAYPVLLDADWGSEGVLKDEEALCLDATHYGNAARFINHRCFDSNMVEIPVEVETPDHHYYHLAFFTTRKVKALEELTWDYGIDFDDNDHPVKAFKCRCGSKFCRNMKRSNRRRRRRFFV